MGAGFGCQEWAEKPKPAFLAPPLPVAWEGDLGQWKLHTKRLPLRPVCVAIWGDRSAGGGLRVQLVDTV